MEQIISNFFLKLGAKEGLAQECGACQKAVYKSMRAAENDSRLQQYIRHRALEVKLEKNQEDGENEGE